MGSGRAVVLLAIVIVALSAIVNVAADTYLMEPPPSNNRLNEANRDRNNGNRLFDSQNNNRGGVNTGTYGRMYYYTKSILRVEWTNQHSCGNPNANCDFIMQYYCDGNVTRDGLTTTTIPDVSTAATNCLLGDCDADTRYGRHESYASYQNCKWRSRNRGLYTSTQDMSNGRNGAIFTRQNNNGDRHGYECPEERDYYPYWHPTIWRDIAILTNDTARCPAWMAESQNVKSRWYCKVTDAYINSQVGPDPGNPRRYGFIPITQEQCESTTVGGVWTEVESWKIPPPVCVQSQWTRDNHLGNTFGGETPHFDWEIPDYLTGDSCVFRLRYNISTSETRNGGEWFSAESVQCGNLNASVNYVYKAPPNGVQIDQNNDQVTAQNPRFFKWADQLDVWSKYGLSKQDNIASFDPTLFYSDTFSTNYPSRGYVFRNDPVVDIFGSLLPRSTLPQTNQPLPTTLVPLRLALDTSQYSRTFQDRSHTFSIRARTAVLAGSPGKIYNLGVRGKRGNIVQTYPSVEYDFSPNQLFVNQGDWVHFQWTGSNTNPGNNAGQGTAGTDRSNIVVLRATGPFPWAPAEISLYRGPFNGTFNGTHITHVSNWKLSYPSRIDSTGLDFMGLSQESKRLLAVGGIYSPYFDLAPQQMRTAGVFNYLCTRNNAFTNRGQKAQIHVSAVENAEALMTTQSAATARLISPSGASWIRYAPDPLGQTTNSQINIQDLDDGRILVTPFLFDVVPGQKVMLDMTYADRPLTEHFIYQSDAESYNGNEMTNAVASNGVISVQITRGGYYHVENQASASAVAGLVIGVVAFFGLVGFGYYQLNRKFHIRNKKHIAIAQDAAPTSV